MTTPELLRPVDPEAPLLVVATRQEAEHLSADLPILLTGIGRINTVAALTEVLADVKPTSVINIGTAGSLGSASGVHRVDGRPCRGETFEPGQLTFHHHRGRPLAGLLLLVAGFVVAPLDALVIVLAVANLLFLTNIAFKSTAAFLVPSRNLIRSRRTLAEMRERRSRGRAAGWKPFADDAELPASSGSWSPTSAPSTTPPRSSTSCSCSRPTTRRPSPSPGA